MVEKTRNFFYLIRCLITFAFFSFLSELLFNALLLLQKKKYFVKNNFKYLFLFSINFLRLNIFVFKKLSLKNYFFGKKLIKKNFTLIAL